MNTTKLKEAWTIARDKLKQKFARLTDDDMWFLEGGQAELLSYKRPTQYREAVRRTLDNGGSQS